MEIDFDFAKKVAIDAYKLADDFFREFYSKKKKSYIKKRHYLLWKPQTNISSEFDFKNLNEFLLFTYADGIFYDYNKKYSNLTEELDKVKKGGNYLVEYPFGSLFSFYKKHDFVRTLSRDTGIIDSICRNVVLVRLRRPYSMFPCGLDENDIDLRDKRIFTTLVAYAKIINDLPEFKDKRLIFYGGKPHAEYFLEKIKEYFPNFPNIVSHKDVSFNLSDILSFFL